MVGSAVAPKITFSWSLLPWNLALKESVRHRHGRDSMDLFHLMLSQSFLPDKVSLVTLLSACSKLSDLARGRRFHASVMGAEWGADVVVATSLLSMYAKSGCVEEALKIFHGMPVKNVVTWNAILTSLLRRGDVGCVFCYFDQMLAHAIRPNRVTVLALLDACSNPPKISSSCSASIEPRSNGLANPWSSGVIDPCSNGSIDPCSNGSIDPCLNRSIDPCSNGSINPCSNGSIDPCSNGSIDPCLNRSIDPCSNRSIDPCLNRSIDLCSNGSIDPRSNGSIDPCSNRSINPCSNGSIDPRSNGSIDPCSNRSIDPCSNGSIDPCLKGSISACSNGLIDPCSNGSISACSNERIDQSLNMLTDSCSGKPIDSRVDMSTEPCPGQSKKLEQGRQAHACIVRESLDTDPIITTSLVNMYGKLEQFGDAERLFSMTNDRDAVLWSSMIALAAHRGLAEEADGLYERMKQEGSMPDTVTLVSVVDAYASEINIRDGKRIHACVAPTALASETALATCIVTMYGKCSDVGNARDVFDAMVEPSLVSWNAMLGAYAGDHQEGCEEAFQVFHSLRNACVLPDSATFACILDACAGNASLPEGKRVHMLVRNSGFERDVVVMTALVNMYGKCGDLEAACAIFEEMEVRNAVTWTALIAAFARNGRYHTAAQLFGEMEQEGIRADGVTFVAILSACRHAGCADEALEWLDLMKRYALAPGEKHYECVIDLLAMAGRLDEAEELAKELPYMPSIVSCTALLQSCIVHRTDVDRGERIAAGAFKVGFAEPAPYVILSKIYVAAQTSLCEDDMKRANDHDHDDMH